MKSFRYGLIALSLLVCSVTSAQSQVSVGIGFPNVSIGINLPLYPELARVPGYPVYYAPNMNSNYFFYDGMYWVYQDDNWYASTWYNGPWSLVGPEVVPLYVLRIPVRYYRQPPVYFRGWQPNAPPRWGQHWGPGWERQRKGWNNWKRNAAPAPAPLPAYQRQYTGDRYPRVDQQKALHSQQYGYQPHDRAVRRQIQQPAEHRYQPPVQQNRRDVTPPGNTRQPDHHLAPHQQGAPAARQVPPAHQPAPVQAAPQHAAPAVQHHEQQTPGQYKQQAPAPQGRGEQPSGHGHGQGQRNDEERGQGHNR